MRRTAALSIGAAFILCSCATAPSQPLPQAVPGARVLLISLGAVTWDDIEKAQPPELLDLLQTGMGGNVSVRVTNSPSDAFATLGAGQRTHTDPSGGWAFDADEMVENGTGMELFERRANAAARGDVLVAVFDQLQDLNERSAFDPTLGALAIALDRVGKRTAVLGNADYSLDELPSLLPSPRRMESREPPDIGVHREIALSTMGPDGAVPTGHVGRDLLEASDQAPYGVQLNVSRLRSELAALLSTSQLVAVETGVTARVDAYTLGRDEEVREAARYDAIRDASHIVGQLVEEVDIRKDLVVVFAPTTPGGLESRGQLRPLIVAGGGVTKGYVTSASTRRNGLITLPDLTATIARHLGVATTRFEAGHAVERIPADPNPKVLADANERAKVNDGLRIPMSAIFVLLQLAVYGTCLAVLRKHRKPGGWLIYALLVILAFPLASFLPAVEVWRVGAGLSGGAVAFLSAALAWLALVLTRSAGRAASALLGLTSILFVVDLLSGTRAQLDSILGYTSVAAGRFYGLGNLGFAIFAAASLILAGEFADRGGKRWQSLIIPGTALMLIGLPQLGGDVGGTLTMVASTIVFAFVLFRRRALPLRWIPLVALAGLAVLSIFGLIDLARPVDERTHLGDFLAAVWQDPMQFLYVVKRKLGLAVSLAVSSRWGLAIPGTVAVFVWLYRRRRSVLERRDGIRAAVQALIVAAILGSLLNDSGVAVAGMMLAVAAPWALIAAANPDEDLIQV